MSRRAKQLLSAVCASAILFGCSEQEAEVQVEIVQPVKTFVVGSSGSTSIRQFPGVIGANQKVDLAFRVSGKLKTLPAREGVFVEKGQVIGQLDPTDYKIVVSDRQASHQEAKANFERGAQLLPKGHISKKDYDGLDASFKSATAALTDARQQLAYTTLKAPFAGQVAKRMVENFEEVQAKQAVIELQDTSSLEVKIDLPEGVVKRIKIGGVKPTIYALFSVAPDKQFPLTIKEFATVADPQTQTFRLTLGMDSPSSITVLPGMTTSVIIDETNVMLDSSTSFVIPLSAVAGDITLQPQVWVVDEASMTVLPRSVRVGALQGLSVEIKEGLQPGDRIVVAGVSFLSEGLKVLLAPDVEQAEPLLEQTRAPQ
ncbi:MAG: efflux RND transporter periplasmic adaptor subunit [Halopseudomonas sp.]